MALKPDGHEWIIKEQIVDDLVTGLKIQFEVKEYNGHKTMYLRLYGDCLEFGNREILFNDDGEESGSGTGFGYFCVPTWLNAVG